MNTFVSCSWDSHVECDRTALAAASGMGWSGNRVRSQLSRVEKEARSYDSLVKEMAND